MAETIIDESTETPVIEAEVEEKDSRVAKVVTVTADATKATVHGLKVAGVSTGKAFKVAGAKTVDTDLRDIGHGVKKASKFVVSPFSKTARAERKARKEDKVLAKAKAITADRRKAAKKA